MLWGWRPLQQRAFLSLQSRCHLGQLPLPVVPGCSPQASVPFQATFQPMSLTHGQCTRILPWLLQAIAGVLLLGSSLHCTLWRGLVTEVIKSLHGAFSFELLLKVKRTGLSTVNLNNELLLQSVSEEKPRIREFHIFQPLCKHLHTYIHTPR